MSLSIDPQHDRPQDLAKFAKKFEAVHPEWLFLTGEPANVEAEELRFLVAGEQDARKLALVPLPGR